MNPKLDEAKSYLSRLESQAKSLRERGRQSSALNRQIETARQQVKMLEEGGLQPPSTNDLLARANKLLKK